MKRRPAKRRSPRVRFWAKVARGRPDECWMFLGALNAERYGVFRVEPEPAPPVYAHRFACADAKGPIPDGMLVRHLCEGRYPPGDLTYRRCVNPRHLEPGTDGDNLRDAYANGRRHRPVNTAKGQRWGGRAKKLEAA